jgi:hypothetical protein
MPNQRCANCNELLTDIEEKARKEASQIEWCCYECFGDGSDNQYTEHGKYIKLLYFVRAIVKRKIYSLGVSIETARYAEELLKEIGEM